MCGLATNCLAEDPQPRALNEPDGVIGGHEYVDLGLTSGTLWATYNVGATNPYEKGYFFAWGEVEPRENFTWPTYDYYDGIGINPNTGSNWVFLEDIGSDISGTEYDAARHHWGNGWRLPTEREGFELSSLHGEYEISEESGVEGVRIHGLNGHSIFMPICGYGLWYGTQDLHHDTHSAYWTGHGDIERGYFGEIIGPSNEAWAIMVYSPSGISSRQYVKAYGLNVRAVVKPGESGIGNVVPDSGKVRLFCRDGCIHVFGNRSEGGLVTVFDLSGRAAYSGSVPDGTCRLPELAGGVYIVSYSYDGRTMATQKMTFK